MAVPACQGGTRNHDSSSHAVTDHPAMVGLRLEDMDRAAKPCEDFYRFVNGGWANSTAIPEEESRWGVFEELHERAEAAMRDLCDEAARDTAAKPGSPWRKLGDYYASAMDEARIERDAAGALEELLGKVAALRSPEDVVPYFAQMQAQGVRLGFMLDIDQDAKDATRVIANVYQGGLGLPDRDYYFRTDEKSKTLREKYQAHLKRTFGLLGEDDAASSAHAALVMELETKLADASMSRVEMRDPNKIYHLMTIAEASKLAPRVDLPRYFREIGAPAVGELNVATPKFFERLSELLGSAPMESWKTYLRWHVVRGVSPALSAKFVEANFDFYNRTLQGVQKMKPRWKRAVAAADRALGDALGEAYVARHFSPRAKERALEMVRNLIAAFRDRLATRAWMSDETRKRAIAKLDTIVPKIGYPDKWRDYTALSVDRSAPFVKNLLAANAFEMRRQVAKIGKPVDRTEWGMTPPTINAYYNPQMNEIAFPAGILQAPFFDERQDDALNYGAMGAVIGHELTHGFDDQGSQFDADGNLKNWWTEKDREEFDRRAEIVVKQFDAFVAIDDLHVNGKLTLGENIADLGGLTIAYHALQRSMKGGARPALIDGFTPEQRFFIAWSRAWREQMRPEALRLMVQTNPHSPARFRAIGPLQNLPEFAAAFGCPATGATARSASERAEIW